MHRATSRSRAAATSASPGAASPRSSSACRRCGPAPGPRGHALADVVRWMATAPADRVGLTHKGRIEVGADADLVRFAPDEEFTVDVADAAPPQPGLGVRRPPAGRRGPRDLAARRTRRREDDCSARTTAEQRSAMTLLRAQGRAAAADRAHHRPGAVHRGLRRHPGPHAQRHHRVATCPAGSATRLWVLARPLSGFAETFSQYVVEVSPGGGSDQPEDDPAAEGVLFVVDGPLTLTVDGAEHALEPGQLRLPPARHRLDAAQRRRRDRDIPLDPQGLPAGRRPRRARRPSSPASRTSTPIPMPGTDGAWSTTRFVDIADLRHDMHVNIVSFAARRCDPVPGDARDGARPLRARGQGGLPAQRRTGSRSRPATSCGCAPSAPRPATPVGPGRFRYLLYKDVNRHVGLTSDPRRVLRSTGQNLPCPRGPRRGAR